MERELDSAWRKFIVWWSGGAQATSGPIVISYADIVGECAEADSTQCRLLKASFCSLAEAAMSVHHWDIHFGRNDVTGSSGDLFRGSEQGRVIGKLHVLRPMTVYLERHY